MQSQVHAVIYARYSSDRQSKSSIEDQLELCRRLIERENWVLLRTYEDRAISGAVRQRPAFQQLLADAERGGFDVVVTESLDRLGRKLADVADLYDRLSFRGIRIVTHAAGEVTQLHIGMLGTMAQLYLSELREKTRRGLMGRVLAGRSAGGLAYGYRVTATGERAIEPSEAEVVRRIFGAFAAGQSPRAIAKTLNAERVPGPDGRPWIDTTIRGQRERGSGILNNELYAGRLVWNRVSYVKDPRTCKRQARSNPPEAWERADEAAEVLRELIEKVVLLPRAEGKGLDAVLHGDLARILQLCEGADEKSGSRKRKLPGQGGPGSQVSVVAGARNCLYLLLFAGALAARSR